MWRPTAKLTSHKNPWMALSWDQPWATVVSLHNKDSMEKPDGQSFAQVATFTGHKQAWPGGMHTQISNTVGTT